MTRSQLLQTVPENSVRFLGHETHAHEVPHLIHVVQGAADLVVDGSPVHLVVHENVWLAPRVPHSARYASDSIVLGPFLSPGTTPSGGVRLLGTVPRLTEVARTILGASPHTADQIQVFREALDEILIGLDNDYFTLRVPTHPIAREIARVAPRTKLTLSQLAGERHASVRHMQRVFRDETELSFTQWRARARLNTAIRRLRGGDGLSAAARIAGYASRASLLKSLSRETGLVRCALTRDPVAALDASPGR